MAAKEIYQIQPIKEASVSELNRLVEELNVRLFSISREIPAASLNYYAKLSDVKDYNVNGGTFTSGAWQTRDLNTEYDPDGIVSLSANQFILQAGTYRIRASCPAYHVNYHVARLYNITDSAEEILGTAEFSGTTGVYTSNRSSIIGEITITEQKTFEIQHQCSATSATNGLGTGTNISGIDSVFTIVEIQRVA